MYEIKFTHKDTVIEVKTVDNAPILHIAGEPVSLVHSVPLLNNKPLVCRIYSDLLETVKATPKKHFNSLEFFPLVKELEHVMSVDQFLRDIRAMNSKGSLDQKIGEEISNAIGSAINGNYKRKSFTLPQRAVIHVISQNHLGYGIDASDLSNCYDPIKDDDSKVESSYKEINKFPFGRFIPATEASKILQSVSEYYDETMFSIHLFRKMRDIAGEDVVNWGPHKWASQLKKAGVKERNYDAYSWLTNDYAKHLLAKGVKPTEKKKTSVDVLKEKEKNDGELTQDELIKLFKNSGESQCVQYVSQMTPASAVSLLSMTTKNVTEKLYRVSGYPNRGTESFRPEAALNAIVTSVACGNNPAEYMALMEFLKTKKLMECCTWELLINHADLVTSEDVYQIAKRDTMDGFLPQAFFDKVISKISAVYKFNCNALVTDAFLRYSATDSEKSQLLNAMQLNGTDSAVINWDLSADHFKSLPYSKIKAFVYDNGPKVGTLHTQWELFSDLILANKDTETARAILVRTGGTDDLVYNLFSLFGYDEKISVLDETKRTDLDIKKILNKQELNDFAKIALTKENLCEYALALPVSEFNEAVKIADVTARLLDEPLYITLNDKMVKGMTKDAAMRALARARLFQESHSGIAELDISLKRELYAKLSREDVISVIGGPISDASSSEYIALAEHMTPEEFTFACDNSPKFLRLYFDKVSDDYLYKFKEDKEAFKNVVGDRRNSNNDSFGERLEKRLDALR